MYKELSRVKTSTGERIKQLMDERGMLQKQLAAELKVSVQTVSAWISENRPPTKQKKKLAEFFNVDEDYIMCKQPERKKKRPELTKREKELSELNTELTFAFIKLLNEKGYDIFPASYKYEDVEYSYMDNNDVVNASCDIKTEVSEYNIYYPDGELITISSEKMDVFVQDITDFIDFSLQKIRNNNSPSRPDIINNQKERSESKFFEIKTTPKVVQESKVFEIKTTKEHSTDSKQTESKSKKGRKGQ